MVGAAWRDTRLSGDPSETRRPAVMTATRREAFCLFHVVSGEDDGGAGVFQGGDSVPGVAAGGGVESGGRLVKEQHLRATCQGQGQVQLSPLPA